MLDAAAKVDIWEAVRDGAAQKDVAIDFGVSQATVSRICSKFRLAEDRRDEELTNEKIVAGDREHGQLWMVEKSGIYFGTCRTRNGKLKKKRFKADGSIPAQKQWEDWKAYILRRDDGEGEDAEPEPFAKKPEQPETADVLPVEGGARVAYVISSHGMDAKPYGLYEDVAAAMEEQERLNAVLGFAGFAPQFEVYEVEWRG